MRENVKKQIKTQRTDYVFLALALGLLVMGLLALYSASTVESFKKFETTTYYFKHQLFYGAGLGLLGMLICSKINYRFWQKLTIPVVLIALGLLIAVKIPGLGFASGGATRWIHIGPLFFQPAEAAKFAIILYTAHWIAGKHKTLHIFKEGVLPWVVLLGLFALLILWQPDVGSMLALVLAPLIMLFAAGLPLRYFMGMAIAGVLGLLAIIKLEPYRAQRILTFLNPSHDKLGIGYQINQALLAIGAGGWWGYGYGLSRQKHNYLPEAIGDSIFAIMAEELGFLRILLILALFAYFLLRGLKISLNAPDLFGKMLGIGIVASLAVQIIINIGAITGILPLTGIPLPFFSYGSSAMIILLCEIGILLNIAKHRT